MRGLLRAGRRLFRSESHYKGITVSDWDVLRACRTNPTRVSGFIPEIHVADPDCYSHTGFSSCFIGEPVLRFFGRASCLLVTIAVKKSDGGWCGSFWLSIDHFNTGALRCSRLPSAAELGVAERGSAKAAAVEGGRSQGKPRRALRGWRSAELARCGA